MRATHLKSVQKSNRATILSFIRQHEPVARHQIAGELALSPTTVSSAVAYLIKQNFVYETGAGPSSGGRRPTMLEIDPDGGIILAVDMSSALPTRILRAAALNLKGDILQEIEWRRSIKGNSSLESTISALLNELLETQKINQKKVLAIGISVPGLVDSRQGTLTAANIGVHKLKLADALKAKFQKPVLVQNSEDVAALGEYYFGAGREASSIFYLSVGHGVGAGMVFDGEIFPRGGLSVGEIGHTTILPSGPLCHCGNRGCLSTLVNSASVVERVKKVLEEDSHSKSEILSIDKKLTIAKIISAATQGDGIAKEVFQETAQWLGIAIGNVINLLNPEMIIFDGELLDNDGFFLELVKKEVKKRAFSEYLQKTTLLRSTLGRNAGLRGIGILALDDLLRASMTG